MENEFLRVEISLKNAKIQKIYDKKHQREWLWQNSEFSSKSCYFDDNWTGGIDDIFPCDEAPEGFDWPYLDHGVLWCGEWELQDDSGGMQFLMDQNGLHVCKNIHLSPDEAAMSITYAIINNTRTEIPYLLRIHPAFPVENGFHLEIPGEIAVCDERFNTLACPGTDDWSWPMMPTSGGLVDFSNLSVIPEGVISFLYVRLREGWFELQDKNRSCSLRLMFPIAVFPYITIFLSRGGWNNYYTAVVEPSSGKFAVLEHNLPNDKQSILAPGAQLEYELNIAIEEGIRR